MAEDYRSELVQAAKKRSGRWLSILEHLEQLNLKEKLKLKIQVENITKWGVAQAILFIYPDKSKSACFSCPVGGISQLEAFVAGLECGLKITPISKIDKLDQ